jgi:hypothetical protein
MGSNVLKVLHDSLYFPNMFRILLDRNIDIANGKKINAMNDIKKKIVLMICTPVPPVIYLWFYAH